MSNLGVSQRNTQLTKFKEFRKEIYVQKMAGATNEQLKVKYGYKSTSAISNLLKGAKDYALIKILGDQLGGLVKKF